MQHPSDEPHKAPGPELARLECGSKPATEVSLETQRAIGVDSEGLLMEAGGTPDSASVVSQKYYELKIACGVPAIQGGHHDSWTTEGTTDRFTKRAQASRSVVSSA